MILPMDLMWSVYCKHLQQRIVAEAHAYCHDPCPKRLINTVNENAHRIQYLC